MGHALALCQCEPIEKPIERRAEDAAQILSRGKKTSSVVDDGGPRWMTEKTALGEQQ
jgi:hypothetical protein